MDFLTFNFSVSTHYVVGKFDIEAEVPFFSGTADEMAIRSGWNIQDEGWDQMTDATGVPGTYVPGDTVTFELLTTSWVQVPANKDNYLVIGVEFYKDGMIVARSANTLRVYKNDYLPLMHGDGTPWSPFSISTPEELDTLRNYTGNDYSSYYFQLVSDIDLSDYLAQGGAGYDKWGNSGWLPIGTEASSFQGTFMGNDYAISGLSFNRPAEKYQSLFGYLIRSAVSNVTVSLSGDSFGGMNTAIIVGYLDINSSLTHCHADTSNYTLHGGILTAMIAGLSRADIEECTAKGNISTELPGPVGGIVGSVSGRVNQCKSDCNIISSAEFSSGIGGIAGYVSEDGQVNECKSSGKITCYFYLGGAVGENRGTIANCVSSVFIDGYRGGYGHAGFVADNVSPGLITNCFSYGEVYGDNSVGGFCGRNTAGAFNIVACYWDTEASGISFSDAGVGLTTLQSKTPSSFSNFDTNIWRFENGEYPELHIFYEEPLPDFDGGDGTEADPYLISNARQLANLDKYKGGEYSDTYWEIIADIDLTDYINNTNPTEGWLPLCIPAVVSQGFCGHLDGGDHQITGLWMNRPDATNAGLFSILSQNAEVKNMTISALGSGIRTRAYTGILAGRFYSTGAGTMNIENVNVTGAIYGTAGYIGGLTGYAYHVNTISDCHASYVDLQSTEPGTTITMTGGLIGSTYGYTGVYRCSATNINITRAIQNVGGLIGSVSNYATISECFVESANVQGQLMVGGFIGSVAGSATSLSNCYARLSEISAQQFGAGFCGKLSTNIRDCYCIVEVNVSTGIKQAAFANSAPSSGGTRMSVDNNEVGIVAFAPGDPEAVSCFYDKSYAMSAGAGNISDLSGAVALSGREMTDMSIYKDAGWDFSTIWGQRGPMEYPEFRWVIGEALPEPIEFSVKALSNYNGEDILFEDELILKWDSFPEDQVNNLLIEEVFVKIRSKRIDGEVWSSWETFTSFGYIQMVALEQKIRDLSSRYFPGTEIQIRLECVYNRYINGENTTYSSPSKTLYKSYDIITPSDTSLKYQAIFEKYYDYYYKGSILWDRNAENDPYFRYRATIKSADIYWHRPADSLGGILIKNNIPNIKNNKYQYFGDTFNYAGIPGEGENTLQYINPMRIYIKVQTWGIDNKGGDVRDVDMATVIPADEDYIILDFPVTKLEASTPYQENAYELNWDIFPEPSQFGFYVLHLRYNGSDGFNRDMIVNINRNTEYNVGMIDHPDKWEYRVSYFNNEGVIVGISDVLEIAPDEPASLPEPLNLKVLAQNMNYNNEAYLFRDTLGFAGITPQSPENNTITHFKFSYRGYTGNDNGNWDILATVPASEVYNNLLDVDIGEGPTTLYELNFNAALFAAGSSYEFRVSTISEKSIGGTNEVAANMAYFYPEMPYYFRQRSFITPKFDFKYEPVLDKNSGLWASKLKVYFDQSEINMFVPAWTYHNFVVRSKSSNLEKTVWGGLHAGLNGTAYATVIDGRYDLANWIVDWNWLGEDWEEGFDLILECYSGLEKIEVVSPQSFDWYNIPGLDDNKSELTPEIQFKNLDGKFGFVWTVPNLPNEQIRGYTLYYRNSSNNVVREALWVQGSGGDSMSTTLAPSKLGLYTDTSYAELAIVPKVSSIPGQELGSPSNTVKVYNIYPLPKTTIRSNKLIATNSDLIDLDWDIVGDKYEYTVGYRTSRNPNDDYTESSSPSSDGSISYNMSLFGLTSFPDYVEFSVATSMMAADGTRIFGDWSDPIRVYYYSNSDPAPGPTNYAIERPDATHLFYNKIDVLINGGTQSTTNPTLSYDVQAQYKLNETDSWSDWVYVLRGLSSDSVGENTWTTHTIDMSTLPTFSPGDQIVFRVIPKTLYTIATDNDIASPSSAEMVRVYPPLAPELTIEYTLDSGVYNITWNWNTIPASYDPHRANRAELSSDLGYAEYKGGARFAVHAGQPSYDMGYVRNTTDTRPTFQTPVFHYIMRTDIFGQYVQTESIPVPREPQEINPPINFTVEPGVFLVDDESNLIFSWVFDEPSDVDSIQYEIQYQARVPYGNWPTSWLPLKQFRVYEQPFVITPAEYAGKISVSGGQYQFRLKVTAERTGTEEVEVFSNNAPYSSQGLTRVLRIDAPEFVETSINTYEEYTVRWRHPNAPDINPITSYTITFEAYNSDGYIRSWSEQLDSSETSFYAAFYHRNFEPGTTIVCNIYAKDKYGFMGKVSEDCVIKNTEPLPAVRSQSASPSLFSVGTPITLKYLLGTGTIPSIVEKVKVYTAVSGSISSTFKLYDIQDFEFNGSSSIQQSTTVKMYLGSPRVAASLQNYLYVHLVDKYGRESANPKLASLVRRDTAAGAPPIYTYGTKWDNALNTKLLVPRDVREAIMSEEMAKGTLIVVDPEMQIQASTGRYFLKFTDSRIPAPEQVPNDYRVGFVLDKSKFTVSPTRMFADITTGNGVLHRMNMWEYTNPPSIKQFNLFDTDELYVFSSNGNQLVLYLDTRKDWVNSHGYIYENGQWVKVR